MYYDNPQETMYTAKLANGQFVYGTEQEILEAGGQRATYEEGETAGNVWDSLKMPRN